MQVFYSLAASSWALPRSLECSVLLVTLRLTPCYATFEWKGILHKDAMLRESWYLDIPTQRPTNKAQSRPSICNLGDELTSVSITTSHQ